MFHKKPPIAEHMNVLLFGDVIISWAMSTPVVRIPRIPSTTAIIVRKIGTLHVRAPTIFCTTVILYRPVINILITKLELDSHNRIVDGMDAKHNSKKLKTPITVEASLRGGHSCRQWHL